MGAVRFIASSIVGTVVTGNPVTGIGMAAIAEGGSNALENDGHPEAAAGLRFGVGSLDGIPSSGCDGSDVNESD